MAKKKNNNLVLASLQMAHVIMKRKRPYTELESVVLQCLEIAADTLNGGEKAIAKVRQISLSDRTTKRRCDRISEDLLNQLFNKLKKTHSYGIQLDKTTDISDEVQLIVYCRFADEEAKIIVEHYLCCLEVGVNQGRLVAKINGEGAASENFGHCFNKQTIKKESLHQLKKLQAKQNKKIYLLYNLYKCKNHPIGMIFVNIYQLYTHTHTARQLSVKKKPLLHKHTRVGSA